MLKPQRSTTREVVHLCGLQSEYVPRQGEVVAEFLRAIVNTNEKLRGQFPDIWDRITSWWASRVFLIKPWWQVATKRQLWQQSRMRLHRASTMHKPKAGKPA